jgi:hypothetical protein
MGEGGSNTDGNNSGTSSSSESLTEPGAFSFTNKVWDVLEALGDDEKEDEEEEEEDEEEEGDVEVEGDEGTINGVCIVPDGVTTAPVTVTEGTETAAADEGVGGGDELINANLEAEANNTTTSTTTSTTDTNTDPDPIIPSSLSPPPNAPNTTTNTDTSPSTSLSAIITPVPAQETMGIRGVLSWVLGMLGDTGDSQARLLTKLTPEEIRGIIDDQIKN